MAVIQLVGDVRRRTGKGGARQVRREGFIPAVLYGAGDDPEAIKIESHTFEKLMRTSDGAHSVIDFKLPKHASMLALIREVQRHPVSRDIVHVDFQRIEEGKPVHVELPIHLVGVARGVKEGGVLDHITRFVDVKCLPRDILSSYDVDVTRLEIGDSIAVRELELQNMELLTEPERTIVVCLAPTVLTEPTAEEVAEAAEVAEGEEAEGEDGEKDKDKDKEKDRDRDKDR